MKRQGKIMSNGREGVMVRKVLGLLLLIMRSVDSLDFS